MPENIHLDVGGTVRDLRLKRGLTLEQLAEKIGATKSTISKLENRKQGFTGELIERIAGALGLKPIDIYNAADQGNTETGPDIKGTVPLLSWVQAGEWQNTLEHLAPEDCERVMTTYKPRRYTYALRVKGDSMEPKFPTGCILIIEPEEDAHNGSYVIVRQNGGEATFKQYVEDGDTKYLKPLNDRYPIMELRKDAVLCGVVKQMTMEV